MDNNRSKIWYLTDGDYINNDLDYDLGQKLVKKREKLLSVIYNIGFVTISLVLMLIVLQLAAKV
ncbi:MAG: hypothetical protein WC209_09020 [Ignavibacteriaceae bacterium]|jgi:hypothetical protein